MSLDALKSINQAEESARKAKASAIQETTKAVADAEKAGQNSIQDARRQAEEETAALIANTEQLVSKEVEDLARSTANKKSVMRNNIEKRLDIVSEYIVGRIVDG